MQCAAASLGRSVCADYQEIDFGHRALLFFLRRFIMRASFLASAGRKDVCSRRRGIDALFGGLATRLTVHQTQQCV